MIYCDLLLLSIKIKSLGSGGGLSIREKSLIYCPPSRIQKERINSEDIFVMNEDGDVIERAKNTKLEYSECLSLFMIPFKVRNAGCCIHSHSIDANLISALYYSKCSKNHTIGDTTSDHECRGEFCITNQEMIKGIKRGSSDGYHSNTDTLVVPIIDNALHESDLAGNFYKTIVEYPLTNAVLVRNHGIFIWGKTWQEAKLMAECYHYLFKLKLDATKYGLD